MDNLTHSLVAVALSRAGLRRISPHATTLLVISANVPDIDIWSIAQSQLSDLEIHRGYTHAFAGMPPLAVLSVLLTALIFREALPFFRAFVIALIGVGSHLLLDWTSSFGIRALLPFSSKWFYLDINAAYDGVILSALTVAFVWPWFADLIASEIGRNARNKGQGGAIAVLLFLTMYEGSRWILHRGALDTLSARLYDGQVPIDVSAIGQPNNPFQWTGVIETQDSFRIVKTGALDFNGGGDARVYRKPPKSPVYDAVMNTEPFRYMAYFSRFPVWDIEPVKLTVGVGQRVDLTDLRFGSPGAGTFHASALADAAGRVLETQFGFTTQEMDRMFTASSTYH